MKRALLLAALVALIAGAGAPAKPFHSLLGIVNEGRSAKLVVLDPETLEVADGPSVVLGPQFGVTWAFSPDRSHFVYADSSRLRFFDLFTFTLERDLFFLGGGDVAWLDAQTVVMLRRADTNAVEVDKVDASTHAVRSRQLLKGTVLATRTLPGMVVALLGRSGKIGPARLLVVGSGRARVVALPTVRAGTVWARNPPVGTMRLPALALDEATRTAYVADPSGFVVEVPLGTLQPVIHALRGSFAKVVHSSQRRALALGDGLLAITGEELSPERLQPAGLQLVDTRTWSSRLLELGARAAWASGEGLLVAGASWDRSAHTRAAMGLALLDRAGQARFRLFGSSSTWVNMVVGKRAYVGVEGETQAVVVELTTGQVIGRRAWSLPRPLLARSSADAF
jgi:hypothetical protein